MSFLLSCLTALVYRILDMHGILTTCKAISNRLFLLAKNHTGRELL